MPIICIMNTLHDACSWTLISVLHSTTPTTSQLLVIAGYQMISLSILQVWSLLVVVVARCSHERRGSTFGIWRTYNDWMYAFVKLKSGITWSGPKQLSTICANKVYKMGDQDLWNNCEKTCWNVAFVFWLQPSTHLRLFEGPGSRASLQSWWWCLAETSLSPSFFFQHFGTFRLATCVIWACFSIFPWHLLCQDQAVQGFADTSSAQEWFDQGGLCSGGCWLTQAGDDDNDDGRCVCLGEVMTTPMPCKWTLDALWIQDFVCFEILATLIKPGAWCWPNQIWSFRSSYGTTLLYDIQHFVRLVNPSFSDSMNLYRSTMES